VTTTLKVAIWGVRAVPLIKPALDKVKVPGRTPAVSEKL
jgi:hypothetical protein